MYLVPPPASGAIVDVIEVQLSPRSN
jgi:hypothetical protein